VFAGKECARALALLKIDEAACNDNLSDVDEAGLKILAEWVKKFKEKYPIK
jgi:membrane-associated progesterone receptor component